MGKKKTVNWKCWLWRLKDLDCVQFKEEILKFVFYMSIMIKGNFVVVLCCNSKTSSKPAPSRCDSSSTPHVEELSTASSVLHVFVFPACWWIRRLMNYSLCGQSTGVQGLQASTLRCFKSLLINFPKTKLWLFVQRHSENPSHPIGGAKCFLSLVSDILVT